MTKSWLHKDFTNACLENMLVTAELENCSPLARGGEFSEFNLSGPGETR